eukprot:5205980-Prymnesium_polylepis.2
MCHCAWKDSPSGSPTDLAAAQQRAERHDECGTPRWDCRDVRCSGMAETSRGPFSGSTLTDSTSRQLACAADHVHGARPEDADVRHTGVSSRHQHADARCASQLASLRVQPARRHHGLRPERRHMHGLQGSMVVHGQRHSGASQCHVGGMDLRLAGVRVLGGHV